MQALRLVATLTLALALPVFAALPRSTPEAQGLPSAGLANLVRALDTRVHEMHSLMILRHGHVVAEGWWAPYAAEHNHVLYSLSKSFTSTAVGFALAEGKLDLFDPVLKHFPDEAPANPAATLKAMRVRDLLTMSTGHQDEPPRSPEAMTVRSFLAHPVPHKPGTHFLYNTPATFMAGAIVQKVTGQTVLDYLRPRLFEPLGIQNPVWDANIEGMSLGGYGLRVKTEDIARFGQLYLQRGWWEGRQLVPETWVNLATSRQMSNGSNPLSDWDQGYGFQFWRSRHGSYRGDGAFGQYCLILPEQDMVVVMTAGTRDMQAVLTLLWEKLLPLPRPEALPEATAAQAELKASLSKLTLRMAGGDATSPLAQSRVERTFVSEDGSQAITVHPSDDERSLRLTWRVGDRDHRYIFGHRRWEYGRGAMDAGALANLPDEPLAGTYGWENANTLVLKTAAYETPFALTHRLSFRDDEVSVATEANVSFGQARRPTWIGRVKRQD